MSLSELFERYDDAWARHDLDTIMSLHSEDGIFQLHMGKEEVSGREQVRAAFVAELQKYPDLRFERRSVRYAGDMIVFEYVMHTSGVQMNALDVFVVAEGLVARKDTYVDATALAAAEAAA